MSKKRMSQATPKKLEEFLEELARCGIVSQAAEICNLERNRLYELRAANLDFAQRWEQAIERSIDLLEQEARRRAYEGVDEPVFYQGEQKGLIRKYSDTLMIFLLKANRPNKYRERITNEITGADGLPLNLAPTITVYMPDNGRDDRDSNT